jgi:hypothetical protein
MKFNELYKHLIEDVDDRSWYYMSDGRLPISSEMLKRLNVNLPRIRALHGLSYENIEKLLLMQGSKLSVSASTHVDKYPHHMSNGWYRCVSVLEGNFLAGFSYDVQSGKGGDYRWIATNLVKCFSYNSNFRDIVSPNAFKQLKSFEEVGKGLFKKGKEKFGDDRDEVLNYYVSEVERLLSGEYKEMLVALSLETLERDKPKYTNEFLINNINVVRLEFWDNEFEEEGLSEEEKLEFLRSYIKSEEGLREFEKVDKVFLGKMGAEGADHWNSQTGRIDKG